MTWCLMYLTVIVCSIVIDHQVPKAMKYKWPQTEFDFPKGVIAIILIGTFIVVHMIIRVIDLSL